MLLDVYKDSQKQFYEAISHSILENRVSHAYFIETSAFANGRDLVFSFAKFLLCPKHNTNLDHCSGCNLCHLIDEGVDNHIYVIEPDGMWIKKEQLENLKNQFSTKSSDGLPQIYIIFEADKLNKSAANSILKFIEEPEEGIIAILVAKNRYQVLPTILSRCQNYTLVGEKESFADIDGDDYLYDFLMNLERNGASTICYLKDLWFNNYKTREDVSNAFIRLEQIFLELLNYKVNSTLPSSTYQDSINFICSRNTISDLIYKLKVIRCAKDALNYNINVALFIDKFIIDYVKEG